MFCSKHNQETFIYSVSHMRVHIRLVFLENGGFPGEAAVNVSVLETYNVTANIYASAGHIGLNFGVYSADFIHHISLYR